MSVTVEVNTIDVRVDVVNPSVGVSVVNPSVSVSTSGPQGPQGVVGPQGEQGEQGIQGPPGDHQARTSTTIVTASIASGATATGVVTLSKGYRVLQIATTLAARVRLYANTAYRDADLPRLPGHDPVGDHGVMLDFVTDPARLAWVCSPLVDAVVLSGADAAWSITNSSGITGPVSVTLTWIATEA